jgi:hypothetical protein
VETKVVNNNQTGVLQETMQTCAHGTKTAQPLYPSSLHCMTKT